MASDFLLTLLSNSSSALLRPNARNLLLPIEFPRFSDDTVGDTFASIVQTLDSKVLSPKLRPKLCKWALKRAVWSDMILQRDRSGSKVKSFDKKEKPLNDNLILICCFELFILIQFNAFKEDRRTASERRSLIDGLFDSAWRQCVTGRGASSCEVF